MRWGEFSKSEPTLASACRRLMYQYGVGLAFLATVRADGGPRVHPLSPLITETGLFAFLIPSPKRIDLVRDGRYAMHSFPCDDNEDAFYLMGTASAVHVARVRAALESQFMQERRLTEPPPGSDEHELFEFDIERCLHTKTTGHGDAAPRHTIWRGGM